MLAWILSARLLLGWGVEGHRLAVRLAGGMLTPAARLEIGRTLGPGESLAALASWADDVRNYRKETDPWHYVYIPLDSTGFDRRRDCPRGDCIIAKIAEFRSEWRNPALSDSKRREALLFLIHLVGDLHQPLHCADNHDKGGNDVHVVFFHRSTNLHAVWDYGLLDHMPPEEKQFSAMRAMITSERAAQWSRGTVEDWADESFHIARSVAYADLPRISGSQPQRLGQAYQFAAEPIVRQQIAKAGVRLAMILNEGTR